MSRTFNISHVWPGQSHVEWEMFHADQGFLSRRYLSECEWVFSVPHWNDNPPDPS